ncbi:methyltransferase domain-containing protein [Neobacillus cucumis]|nr:methyltransferase domain-containing protein [Neobacillus cucumis]
MEQYLDRISEAYDGKLGPRLAQKTRERVHWIIKNVVGKNVLDIGCSQGLVSLLLGREGKNVLGIDIAEESIHFANESLTKEQETTKQLVKFIQGNFLYEELPEQHFDTIIITEVLEHFFTSNEILKKAESHLKDEGRIIITVPFGINDFPDHKRTLYLMEIYKEMSPSFKMEQVEFMGKWIGFIGTKGKNNLDTIPEKLFFDTEKAFYLIERELTDKNNSLKDQVLNYKSKMEELKKNEKQLLSREGEYKEKNGALNKKVENLEGKLKEQLLANENLKVKSKESETKHLEVIEKLKKQLEENKTVIKGLQTDSNRMQEKISTIITNFSAEKEKLEEANKNLKNTNKIISNKIEEKNHQLTELIYLKDGLAKDYQEKIKTIKEDRQRFIEETNQLQQKIETTRVQFKQKIEEEKNKIEILVKENQSLHQVNNQFLKEKEALLNHLNELEALEPKLTSEILNAKEVNQELMQKLQVLENTINSTKSNHQNEKEIFYLKFKEKEEIIQNLNKEIFGLKRNIQINEQENKRELLKLKETTTNLLEESEDITRKLIKEIKEKNKLQHKYDSLRNSKLGKVTMKYWAIKKK